MENKTTFAIFLHEAPDGSIEVETHSTGHGFNSFEIGLSILGDLYQIQRDNPDAMTIKPPTLSAEWH